VRFVVHAFLHCAKSTEHSISQSRVVPHSARHVFAFVVQLGIVASGVGVGVGVGVGAALIALALSAAGSSSSGPSTGAAQPATKIHGVTHTSIR
jgi:hypothetical protein